MPAARRALPIVALVALALGLRCWAFSPFAIHHPDEQIQYLEQAHRLVFGVGVVPWEYRIGMRSWVVPLLLAGPMWLGEALAPGGTLYVVLPRLAFAALALAPLWAAWRIGALASRRHALMALAVAGLWYESVYFSVHVLTEMLATALLLPAAALLLGGRTRARVAVAGALLCCAVVARFHYAPAAAALAAGVLRTDRREWRWLAGGALVPAAIAGTVDLAMGQWPFAWIAANVWQNLVAGRAAEFGVAGGGAYLRMVWQAWAVAIVPIGWLALVGARRFPVLAAVAVVNLAVHLAVGHKEYRFILLSTQLVLLLAAIGTVDALAARGWNGRTAFAGALAGWAATSAVLAWAAVDPGWRRYGAGYALLRQAAVERTCAVAILAGPTWPPLGRTWLHRPVPQYLYVGADGPAALVWNTAAFDAVVAPAGAVPALPGYRPRGCAGHGDERQCLLRRPGGCAPGPAAAAHEVQRVMIDNRR